MDRRTKAALNRDKAIRLAEAWGVGALQVRYSDDGHWYAVLDRFPAALFDAHGYLLFKTKDDYTGSSHLRIGKQISIPKPGISAVPGYILVATSESVPSLDVDIHTLTASEGRRRLVAHLERERSRTLVKTKKRAAASLDCEVCGFSFSRTYGPSAAEYCEVHHLVPLSQIDQITQTRIEDLGIVCANCHRVIHLRNPPYTFSEVRRLLNP
jgi:5-methylcytosine-specific restriction endonuclease McrA